MNIELFDFEGNEVRFVGTALKPEWVAADVCRILELNTSEAVNGHKRSLVDGTVYYDGGLDDDEKGMVILHTPGGEQEILTVTEPGLYRLIFKSRKPIAKRFQRWIIHEVLPSIRKTGGYTIPNQQPTQPDNFLTSSSSSSLAVQDQITVIDYMFAGFTKAGVDLKIVESAKMESLAAQFPSMKPAIELAKQSLMLQTPDEGRRYNVTELGKMLAEKLGLDKDIKPTQINEALQQVGFQEAKYRTNSKGKQVKEWHLTTAGESYGRLFLQSAQSNSKTIPAIRWLPEVLDEIVSRVNR